MSRPLSEHTTSEETLPVGQQGRFSSQSREESDTGLYTTDSGPAKKEKSEAEHDPDLVTWNGPDDPKDPKNWSKSHKWAITAVSSSPIEFDLPLFADTPFPLDCVRVLFHLTGILLDSGTGPTRHLERVQSYQRGRTEPDVQYLCAGLCLWPAVSGASLRRIRTPDCSPIGQPVLLPFQPCLWLLEQQERNVGF